jgi:hypothetical protein
MVERHRDRRVGAQVAEALKAARALLARLAASALHVQRGVRRTGAEVDHRVAGKQPVGDVGVYLDRPGSQQRDAEEGE